MYTLMFAQMIANIHTKGLHSLLANTSVLAAAVVHGDGLFAVAGSLWVVVFGTWDFASKLLEGLALGLGDQKGGEDTEEHLWIC